MLIICILLIAIGVSEIFSTLLLKQIVRKTPEHSGFSNMKFLRSENKDQLSGAYTPTPYSIYWNKKNYTDRSSQHIQTDQHGYRITTHESNLIYEKTILCLGGSTTYSDETSKNPADSWPFKLTTQMRQRTKLKFRVLNAGLNGATSGELLSHYVFHGQHHDSEVIIWEGPGNDITNLKLGDFTYDYEKTRIPVMHRVRPKEKILLSRSRTLQLLYTFWLNNSEPMSYLTDDSSKITYAKLVEILSSEAITPFEKNLDTLVKLASANGSLVFFVDFLNAPRETMEKLYPSNSQEIIKVHNLLNSIFTKIAEKYPKKAFHITLDASKFQTHDFLDNCHLTKHGETIKAGEIAEKIASSFEGY